VLWLVQQRTRDAGIIDVGWAGSFAGGAGLLAWRADAPAEAWLPIAAIVAAWSARLTGYLVARGAARSPEEGRYAALRAK
jgi:steroid 5-alpha reductase family enzyme